MSGATRSDMSYSDYDVFLSGLDDFKKAVHAAGLDDKVVYLDRKDAYRFEVTGERSMHGHPFP